MEPSGAKLAGKLWAYQRINPHPVQRAIFVGQKMRLRQDKQVLVPVQFPDRFVVAGTRRVQVGNKAEIFQPGLDPTQVVATPTNVGSGVDSGRENWKLVALELIREIDDLLRALAAGGGIGQRQPWIRNRRRRREREAAR